MWVSLDSQLASLIPWEVRLLDFVTFSMKTTHLLVVVQRKVYDTEFRVPRPDASNYRILDEIRSRHATVIDGSDGRQADEISHQREHPRERIH